jgi:hypothetical protein
MVVKPKNIDEYLAALSDDKRAALERIRKIIRAAVPKAEECISYQLPAFRLDGKCFVWFGANSRITTPARARSVFKPTRPCLLPSCGSLSSPGSQRTWIEAIKHRVLTTSNRKPRLRSNRNALPHRRPAALFSVRIFVRRNAKAESTTSEHLTR